MALSEAQVFGYSTNVQELFRKAQKALEAGHVDVDAVVGELEALHEKAAQANAVQEEAKRRSKEATDEFLPLKLALARKTSSALDMAIGAVGKETTAAANFRRLRSDIQRATAADEVGAAPAPLPEPVERA